MNKVILDTSVLGLGYFHEQSRTGIFRVAEELFKGLHTSNEIELSLANSENLPEIISYLKKYFHWMVWAVVVVANVLLSYL